MVAMESIRDESVICDGEVRCRMKAENGQGTPIEADYCATPVRKPLRNITFALQRTAPNQACQSLHVLRFPGHKSTREGQGV